MLRGLLSLYSWRYPARLVSLWQQYPDVRAYLRAYWRTTDFSKITPETVNQPIAQARFKRVFLYVWACAQIGVSVAIALFWHYQGLTGGWQFAVAVFLAYPLVLAYLLLFVNGLWMILHPKALGRIIVCRILEGQVKRLRKRNSFTVVAVAGSIGKTSTKIAVAKVLQASRRVQWQEGNYNDRVTVPLIFFGHTQPSLFNVFAWTDIFLKNEQQLRRPYPFEAVVAELGTDHPGSIEEFAYLKPELVILTAVTPEHMEYFKTLDAVAREELTALEFAGQSLVNADDTPVQYLEGRSYLSYGVQTTADYTVSERKAKGLQGQIVTFALGKKDTVTLTIPLLGEHGAKIALAAGATAHILGLPLPDIQKGLADISAFAGRMQVLPGKLNSTIIDDTYNATPLAVKAALDVIYSGDAPQRIAILGSMNELGSHSPAAHREVGEHCDPAKLDWVITIGKDAKEYLAPVAKERGCQVKSFLDPYRAGRFAEKQLKEGAVVLAKGSQNGVFAEEAIKVLMRNPEDEAKLVRQSGYWLRVKARQFKS